MKRIFAICLLLASCDKTPISTVPDEAYVWQSPGRKEVREAVGAASDFISTFHFRAAEIKWQDGRFLIDEVLDELPVPGCGLVVRIGASASGLDWSAERMGELAGIFGKLAKLGPAEIQCDFDCPQSRLEGYILLLDELRRTCGKVPVVPTVLPSWLDEPAFAKLVYSLDAESGYVLQVHSLVLPDGPHQEPVIFDPVATERYVQKAEALGKPFRIAMATYGCEVRFDAKEKVINVVSEDTGSMHMNFATRSFALADPVASARLVRRWKDDPPRGLRGIVWYRLPVSGDRRNWPMATLRLVAAGEVREEVADPELAGDSGTRDIFMKNGGDFPVRLPSEFVVDSAVKAADGVGAYRMERMSEGISFKLRSDVWPWLFPSEKIVCGWMISGDDSGEVDIKVLR